MQFFYLYEITILKHNGLTCISLIFIETNCRKDIKTHLLDSIYFWTIPVFLLEINRMKIPKTQL